MAQISVCCQISKVWVVKVNTSSISTAVMIVIFYMRSQLLSFDAASRAQALTEGKLMNLSQRPQFCLFHGLELDVFVSSQVW